MADNVQRPEPGSVLVLATSWCPFCARLLHGLEAADVRVSTIDIDRDEQAARFVESVNRGNRTVPTVLFPDGTVRTNPPVADVLRLLED